MNSLSSLYDQVLFLLSSLTWFGLLDLLLVTGAFYLLLSLIRRSSAAYLLREVLIIGLGLFFLTALLPLPVFDWLVRAVLVAMLIATPIIFQAQLRQYLSRISRASGLGRAARQSSAETVLPEIMHAVENMASTQTGALIVLEGNDSLDEIAQSGISSGARVTSELLQSMFYPGTPLHDGAVLIRTDRVMAAGCVLPLTQQPLPAEKRLGTRHRAAVGMSEVSDALVVVVSEETGHVGVAQHGELDRPLNNAELRDRLQDFYEPDGRKTTSVSIWDVVKNLASQVWQPGSFSKPRHLLSNLGLLVVSLMFTLVVWTFVMQQTNAIELARVEGIPLRVENVPPNTKIIPPPPASVSAVIQATKAILPTLSPRSFQAVARFEQTEPGLYRLPVEVTSSVGQVRVMSAEPAAIDLELAPVISQTMPVMVNIVDQDNLSPAYEIVGPPSVMPQQVDVQGPAPLVNEVSQVQANIALANTNTSLRETRPLRAVNEQGQEVTGITLQPDQAQVVVTIRQRLNAADVSVQATITGTPPSGYQLRSVGVVPPNVTLRGSIEQLAQVGSVVRTVPVDIGQVTSELIVQTPLDLPPNVQALDATGAPARTVTVSIRVAPLSGNLSITRPVELTNISPTLSTTINPPEVNLLLSGPVPILDDIEATPGLVQILVDGDGLEAGQSVNVPPQVVAPNGIQYQVVPPTVSLTVQQPATPTPTPSELGNLLGRDGTPTARR